MKHFIKILFFITITISYPSFASTFGAQEATLENGMQIVVIPNHRSPVVTHMIWVKVGGADNLPSQSGMAHYFEHLMFKGTPTLGAGEYSKTIKTLGGNDNAFTGADYTAYFESVAVANLPRVMEMAADRIQNLSPPIDHFISEKLVVLEERRQRTDNDPRSLLAEQMNAALYTNHPYGTPVIGWMDEIKNYEWDDVKEYYDTWYQPNNMVAVISGDITMEEFLPLAKKYYETIPRKELPDRIRPLIPSANAQTIITLSHKQVKQPEYFKTYIAPTESKDRKDSLSLQVLFNILDGGPTTRLSQRLIIEQKKAINISIYYLANALDYASIFFEATPAEGVTPEEIGNLIENEIKKVMTDGVTDIEVKDAVQRLQDEAVFARDSITGPAMIFGQAITTGSSVADIENWSDDISKITAGDVKLAAQKYLDAKNPWVRAPVIGFLLPEQKESNQ